MMINKVERRRFKELLPAPQFNIRTVMDLLHDPVLKNEIGPGSIRRFLAPESDDLFAALGRAIGELFDGTFEHGPTTELGLTLMRKSELRNVRRPPASRLRKFSYDLARERVKDMLPDSARELTIISLGKIVISKPREGQRRVIMEANRVSTIIKERSCLTNGIDEYEGVGHAWTNMKPHITLGAVPSSNLSENRYAELRKLNGEFRHADAILLPVE